MKYELAKKLKGAGFPMDYELDNFTEFDKQGDWINIDLLELIEACGATTKNNPWGDEVGAFEFCLQFVGTGWKAGYKEPNYNEDWDDVVGGATTEEAVAELWLALNKAV